MITPKLRNRRGNFIINRLKKQKKLVSGERLDIETTKYL